MGNVFRFETLDSSNTKAISMARAGKMECAVVCKKQTAGRGRLGRSFVSPEGGTYLSVLTSRLQPGAQVYALTPAAALAVRRSILRVFGLSCGIKYPNDLILEGKKVCGILCESLSLPDRFCVVVGVGVNVYSDVALPEDSLAGDYPPGSLKEFCGKAGAPEALRELEDALIEELGAVIDTFAAGGSFDEDEYRAHCINCPEIIVQI
ncbi:MAG: biotin--[acetyl-CoA-carboxylase] ligase [Clostridia bacterium]|nr:biotin--[acetyl-CoA-carboxylase] ligase [Clostridia bacterium]